MVEFGRRFVPGHYERRTRFGGCVVVAVGRIAGQVASTTRPAFLISKFVLGVPSSSSIILDKTSSLCPRLPFFLSFFSGLVDNAISPDRILRKLYDPRRNVHP